MPLLYFLNAVCSFTHCPETATPRFCSPAVCLRTCKSRALRWSWALPAARALIPAGSLWGLCSTSPAWPCLPGTQLRDGCVWRHQLVMAVEALSLRVSQLVMIFAVGLELPLVNWARAESRSLPSMGWRASGAGSCSSQRRMRVLSCTCLGRRRKAVHTIQQVLSLLLVHTELKPTCCLLAVVTCYQAADP